MASIAGEIGRSLKEKLSPTSLFALVDEASRRYWQLLWDTDDRGRRLHGISPQVLTTPWFAQSDLPRNTVTMLCRLRNGHSFSRASLARLGIVRGDTCRCGAVETAQHKLFHCPLIDRGRFGRELCRLNIRPRNYREFLQNPARVAPAVTVLLADNPDINL